VDIEVHRNVHLYGGRENRQNTVEAANAEVARDENSLVIRMTMEWTLRL